MSMIAGCNWPQYELLTSYVTILLFITSELYTEIIIQSNFQLTPTNCLDLNQSSGNKKLTEVKLMMSPF